MTVMHRANLFAIDQPIARATCHVDDRINRVHPRVAIVAVVHFCGGEDLQHVVGPRRTAIDAERRGRSVSGFRCHLPTLSKHHSNSTEFRSRGIAARAVFN